MHALAVSDTINVSGPRNNFELAGPEANRHLLIAGGIGITPMLSMIDELEARSAEFHLHFCARDERRAPFLDRLQRLVAEGRATIHLDNGDPGRGLHLPSTLQMPEPAQHVYFCGPPAMLEVARACVGAWAPHTVHF